jgi:uncharacterized membrane protein
MSNDLVKQNEQPEEKLGLSDNICKMIFYFLACGFMGWIVETIDVWITTGKLTDRGILFFTPLPIGLPLIWGLPIIFLYGFGGVAVVYLLKRYKKSPVALFITGLVSMTLIELGTSYLMEATIHRSYWDYSNSFMNFDGRICLTSSIAWGVLSMVLVYGLMPAVEHIFKELDTKKIFKIIIYFLAAYAVICMALRGWLFPNMD